MLKNGSKEILHEVKFDLMEAKLKIMTSKFCDLSFSYGQKMTKTTFTSMKVFTKMKKY